MKTRTKLFLIILSIMILAACGVLPTLPALIPPDPLGVSKPDPWGDDVEIYGSVDKAPILTPIDLPLAVKIRVNIPGYEEGLTSGNFLVFEDNRAQGFILIKESEERSGADIVFIVDVTGSMSEEIEGVKNSMVDFIQSLETEGLDVKVGIVPYSDYAPSSTTDSVGFDPAFLNLSDPTTAADYANNLSASGGNDTPENAYGAIMYAWKNMSWRKETQRIFILITDAPSHYEGDSDWSDSTNDFDPKYTKSDVINALYGFATLHIVASTGGYYSDTDTDFSDPGDPREIAVLTGGLIIYQDPYGAPDLPAIGIAEHIASSWIIIFESDSPTASHNIDIYFEGPDDKRGELHLVGVTY